MAVEAISILERACSEPVGAWNREELRVFDCQYSKG
jgi:hypothetical protein